MVNVVLVWYTRQTYNVEAYIDEFESDIYCIVIYCMKKMDPDGLVIVSLVRYDMGRYGLSRCSYDENRMYRYGTVIFSTEKLGFDKLGCGYIQLASSKFSRYMAWKEIATKTMDYTDMEWTYMTQQTFLMDKHGMNFMDRSVICRFF